jgi:hypothetical protein
MRETGRRMSDGLAEGDNRGADMLRTDCLGKRRKG